MTIDTYRSRRHRATDPASPAIMTFEEIHMLAVDTARTIFRVLAPILARGSDGPGGWIYTKILIDLMNRHSKKIDATSYVNTRSNYYRRNVIIRMNDLHYWGKPNAGSMWDDGVAA